MTAVVPHKSYMTQHPFLFTLINHCVIAFSFALMFTIVVSLLRAMASCSAPVCWLSHVKQYAIVHCHMKQCHDPSFCSYAVTLLLFGQW